MITVFLGGPGTGKGTVSKELAEKYGYKHISTGDIFREIIKSGSELGNKVKEIIESGNLINDDMTNEVLVEGLKKYDLENDKIILDGYPRTIPQAEFLDKLVAEENIVFDKAILLTLDPEVQLKRLTGRRICPTCGASYHQEFLKPQVEGKCDHDGAELIQREDDKIENVQVRLNTYNELTAPLIDYYKNKGMIFEIDTENDYKELAKQIDEELNA
jgi:adenylate kinase